MTSDETLFHADDIQLHDYLNPGGDQGRPTEPPQTQPEETPQPEPNPPAQNGPNEPARADSNDPPQKPTESKPPELTNSPRLKPGRSDQAKSGAPQPREFKRFSELLKHVDSNECHLILANFEAGLLEGRVKAVGVIDVKRGKVKFKKTVVCGDGRKRVMSIQDELVVADPAFYAWLAEQKKASQYEVLVYQGVIGIPETQVESGEHDFDALLQARVGRLRLSSASTSQAEQPRKRKRKEAEEKPGPDDKAAES
ncbi:hypothetical protein [Deinococcus hopiensis]|uniref:Uncharacterized protein n=1 Tax=Deinococcus hopiensis KR-140 TaxID=695939 RepID=A0A1W1ULI6_9DEIO|nr:hypothetical protein [Deinococcus hopiensis]SMB81947.1 hypothetical protein SAMN00790413_04782 [Deinococcus hopiensis KR-140]